MRPVSLKPSDLQPPSRPDRGCPRSAHRPAQTPPPRKGDTGRPVIAPFTSKHPEGGAEAKPALTPSRPAEPQHSPRQLAYLPARAGAEGSVGTRRARRRQERGREGRERGPGAGLGVLTQDGGSLVETRLSPLGQCRIGGLYLMGQAPRARPGYVSGSPSVAW